MTVKIPIEDLRVGMFVHLDLGWMSHPFPLSSFKISSHEQIDTIRGLGLKQLRWDAARSEIPDTEPAPLTVPAALDELPPAPPWTPPAQREVQLLKQQTTQQLVERQFGEACRDLRKVNDLVLQVPQQARESTQQLTRAMLDKMLVEGDTCLRMLGDHAVDRGTAHAMNVSVLSLLLGRQIGLTEHELLELGMGALLHDIGKVQLPDRLRLPHDDFSSSERQLYRDHVAHGVTLGRRMGLSAGALLVIAQHHEMADGSGFPAGNPLERMTQAARIVSLVNVYDNLCNAPVAARSLTPHEALSRMFAQSRSRFDTSLLNAFIRMMGIYPPGSLVQLSDERFALVTSVNSSRPLKPTVLIPEGGSRPDQTLRVNLEALPNLGVRRCVKPQQLPGKLSDLLAPRHRLSYFFDVASPQTEPLPTC